MIRNLGVLLGALSLVANPVAAYEPNASAVPLPGLVFQHDTAAVVFFVSREKVNILCGAPVEETRLVACAQVGGNRMVMPNPCQFPDEFYARVACHEISHLSGWPADHPL